MTTAGVIQLIVEGAGDYGAVPVLLRRYLYHLGDYRAITFGKPIAAHGVSNLTKPGGVEGYIRLAAARPHTQLIVVLVDSDKECVVERANELLARCGAPVPVLMALADRNFEDWIYASAETTLGQSAEYVEGTNSLAAIKSARSYTKSVDQAKLAAAIDFDLAAMRNHSFARLLSRFDAARQSLSV